VSQARRTGSGCHVETSLARAATLYQSLEPFADQLSNGTGGLAAVGSCDESRLWRASDGWIFAVLRDGALDRFRAALGGGELAGATAQHPHAELIALARQCGGVAVRAVDDERLRDAMIDDGRFRTAEQPGWGPVGHVGYPARFDPPIVDSWLPAPGWGQHTREILVEIGMSPTDIDDLYRHHVVE
jgi:crotonobetainyl-CoA:carnitine CoA-transferase CaiB-like acyl-CoA transferase